MAQIDDSLEYSFMWPGISLGDAAKAPYNAAYGEEVMALRMELGSVYDRTVQGVIDTDHTDYAGKLALSSPAINQLRIASGAAIVNGWHYLNLDDRDFTVDDSEQYRIVLRRGISTAPVSQQTVRLVILNTPAGAPPAVTQTVITWEIELGTVVVDGGGVLAITPTAVWAGLRVNTGNIKALAVDVAQIATNAVTIAKMGFTTIEVTERQGGHATAWCSPGTTDYAVAEDVLDMQVGAIELTLPIAVDPYISGSVTFPHVFADCPIVVVTVATEIDITTYHLTAWIDAVATTGFDLYLKCVGNLAGTAGITIMWTAIGTKT